MSEKTCEKVKKSLANEKNFFPALTTFSTAFTFALISIHSPSTEMETICLNFSIIANSLAFPIFLAATIITRIPNPDLCKTLLRIECYKYINLIIPFGYISIALAVQSIFFYISPLAGKTATITAVFLIIIIIKLYAHMISSKLKKIIEKI